MTLAEVRARARRRRAALAGETFVYVLELGNGGLYVGIAKDIDQRLTQHRRGHGSSVARFYGVKRLSAVITCPDRATAEELEIFWTKALLKERLPGVGRALVLRPELPGAEGQGRGRAEGDDFG